MSGACYEDPPGPLHVREATDPLVCVDCGDVAESEAHIAFSLFQHQPRPGSVVLAEGPSGTAWQRMHAAPQNWRSVTGRGSTWARLMEASRPGSPVILVYVAPER